MNINKNHVINDPLAVIYNEGQWRLSKVSPLLNLQSSAVKLKQYASKIRQSIVSTIPSNSAIKYTVLLEAQPHLKYSEDDPDGLTIMVSSSQETTKSKVVYTSIFLSWGVSTKMAEAVHLPYMLERGEQRIGTTVKTTLQNMFDCNIKQFCFTQHQLLQFGFNFVENDTSRSTDPFTFCYRTQQVDHKNKLNLTFEVGDVHIIWNGGGGCLVAVTSDGTSLLVHAIVGGLGRCSSKTRIKEDLSKTSEQVTLAYQILQNQIFYTVMLDVTALDLCEVNLSKAEVKSNGTIKMKTPEIVNSVFTVLNEIINTHAIDNNDTVLEL